MDSHHTPTSVNAWQCPSGWQQQAVPVGDSLKYTCHMNINCYTSATLGDDGFLCVSDDPGGFSQIQSFKGVDVDTGAMHVTQTITRVPDDESDPLSWKVTINGEERTTANNMLDCQGVICTTEIDGQTVEIPTGSGGLLNCMDKHNCVITAGPNQTLELQQKSLLHENGRYAASFNIPGQPNHPGIFNISWPDSTAV